MAKYRGRKIAGVSIANPRRITKKEARARAYVSLHGSDGLKDESMKTPRSFVDSTISTDFPSVNIRGAVGGCIGTACAKRDLGAPFMGNIKSPRNSCQGAGLIFQS